MARILIQHSVAVESRLLFFVLCSHCYSEHSPSSLSADLDPYFSSHKHRLDGSQGHFRLNLPPRKEKHKILLTVYTPAALSEDPHAHQYLTFAYFGFKTVLLEMQSRLTSKLKSTCLGFRSAGIAYRLEQPCPARLHAYSHFSR